MIDTLKLSKRLQASGMEAKMADGVADALREALTDYGTRDYATGDYLETKLAEFKRFVIVSFALIGIAQILIVKFWH
jgi:hypothetical protein